jgi:superfamily II DNA or RNA helicase
MQKLKQGVVLLARSRRWRVEDTRPYDGCDLIVLTGAEAANIGQQCFLLSPFDTLEPIVARPRPRRVRVARWRAACRVLVRSESPPGNLRRAAAASIDLFPHQLEPALAIVRGLGARVLLADDVGLGKTMEAALVVAELRARGAADRVLILTPAGLRDQWHSELASRVNLEATVMDAAEVRRRLSTLPVGVNPWSTTPIAIASLDYAKRPEVLPAISSCRWDVLIVDEAHGVAGDSDRRRAAESLAAQAVYVLLLSATPHNGDTDAFAALCRMGAATSDGPILVFRRTRGEVRIGPGRKVRRLLVRSAPAEARVHRLLTRFIDAVARERGEDVRLAAGVLLKRACSSARSLEQSVERRLAVLDAGTAPDQASQLTLPLDVAGEVSAEDDVPQWHPDVRLDDPSKEQRMLNEIAAAARAAAAHETKVAAINRLLRRVREPIIVFTEYRDTLLNLAARLRRRSAVLHGGLTRPERSKAIAAFASAGVDLLLATDAAGEGLNLQQRCRVVVNVELPWNPMRLEQRIGRVDRIGQRRTVHAIHLVARGTVEVNMLARLRARVTRAQEEVGASDPLGSLATGAPGSQWPSTNLRNESCREAKRLTLVRSCPCGDDRQLALLAASGPWVARSRSSTTRSRLAGRTLLVFQATCEDGNGRIVESRIVSLAVADKSGRSLELARGDPRDPRLADVLQAALLEWQADSRRIHERFMSCRLAREEATALNRRSSPDLHQLQVGLFDRRAETASLLAMRRDERELSESSARLRALEAATELHLVEPCLLLVLVP